MMENPIKMDDLGVPLFLETPMYPFKMFLLLKVIGFQHYHVSVPNCLLKKHANLCGIQSYEFFDFLYL